MMMEWLKKVRAPKFYRYWFYRQYMLSKSLGDDDSNYSSAIGSSFIFLAHFLILMHITLNGINKGFSRFSFLNLRSYHIVLLLGFFLLISYLVFIYQGKWEAILKEFEGESRNEKKWGHVFVVMYILASVLGHFIILFWFTEP